MDVIRWSVALLAATLGVALAVPAAAVPDDDRARVGRALEHAAEQLEAATGRAQQAAASYAEAVAALPAAETAVAEAQGRVAAAEAAVRRAEREAQAARAEQAAADARFVAASGRVEAARAEVGRFAAATYKGANFELLDSIVNAGSPTEFAVRLGYLDKVADSRRRALDSLTAARTRAREERAAAAEADRRAGDAAATAERTLLASRTAAAAARAADERVRDLVAQREAAVATANEERSAVLARYDELKVESSRIEAELQAAAARRRATPAARAAAPAAPAPAAAGPGGGFFMMPVRGRKTSNFGSRFHPIFHAWIMHTGMDITGGTGTPIVSAGDGEVINAGWRRGYGNYTCVHHGEHQGKGLATCYGHQSQILVQAGQQVRRGQLIGRVGSTGNSTGPHLHFEVRVAGSPVDPAKWLPSCLC